MRRRTMFNVLNTVTPFESFDLPNRNMFCNWILNPTLKIALNKMAKKEIQLNFPLKELSRQTKLEQELRLHADHTVRPGEATAKTPTEQSTKKKVRVIPKANESVKGREATHTSPMKDATSAHKVRPNARAEYSHENGILTSQENARANVLTSKYTPIDTTKTCDSAHKLALKVEQSNEENILVERSDVSTENIALGDGKVTTKTGKNTQKQEKVTLKSKRDALDMDNDSDHEVLPNTSIEDINVDSTRTCGPQDELTFDDVSTYLTDAICGMGSCSKKNAQDGDVPRDQVKAIIKETLQKLISLGLKESDVSFLDQFYFLSRESARKTSKEQDKWKENLRIRAHSALKMLSNKQVALSSEKGRADNTVDINDDDENIVCGVDCDNSTLGNYVVAGEKSKDSTNDVSCILMLDVDKNEKAPALKNEGNTVHVFDGNTVEEKGDGDIDTDLPGNDKAKQNVLVEKNNANHHLVTNGNCERKTGNLCLEEDGVPTESKEDSSEHSNKEILHHECYDNGRVYFGDMKDSNGSNNLNIECVIVVQDKESVDDTKDHNRGHLVVKTDVVLSKPKTSIHGSSTTTRALDSIGELRSLSAREGLVNNKDKHRHTEDERLAANCTKNMQLTANAAEIKYVTGRRHNPVQGHLFERQTFESESSISAAALAHSVNSFGGSQTPILQTKKRLHIGPNSHYVQCRRLSKGREPDNIGSGDGCYLLSQTYLESFPMCAKITYRECHQIVKLKHEHCIEKMECLSRTCAESEPACGIAKSVSKADTPFGRTDILEIPSRQNKLSRISLEQKEKSYLEQTGVSKTSRKRLDEKSLSSKRKYPFDGGGKSEIALLLRAPNIAGILTLDNDNKMQFKVKTAKRTNEHTDFKKDDAGRLKNETTAMVRRYSNTEESTLGETASVNELDVAGAELEDETRVNVHVAMTMGHSFPIGISMSPVICNTCRVQILGNTTIVAYLSDATNGKWRKDCLTIGDSRRYLTYNVWVQIGEHNTIEGGAKSPNAEDCLEISASQNRPRLNTKTSEDICPHEDTYPDANNRLQEDENIFTVDGVCPHKDTFADEDFCRHEDTCQYENIHLLEDENIFTVDGVCPQKYTFAGEGVCPHDDTCQYEDKHLHEDENIFPVDDVCLNKDTFTDDDVHRHEDTCQHENMHLHENENIFMVDDVCPQKDSFTDEDVCPQEGTCQDENIHLHEDENIFTVDDVCPEKDTFADVDVGRHKDTCQYENIHIQENESIFTADDVFPNENIFADDSICLAGNPFTLDDKFPHLYRRGHMSLGGHLSI